jgi:hypothetical protein
MKTKKWCQQKKSKSKKWRKVMMIHTLTWRETRRCKRTITLRTMSSSTHRHTTLTSSKR